MQNLLRQMNLKNRDISLDRICVQEIGKTDEEMSEITAS